MRFGETRDPAPTTMEELAPGGLLAKLSRMDVVARRAVRGARSGERRSRKRGGGLEFSEHRDYEPGDDLRFVDWNVFARLDRLVTKVFIEEEDLTVALLLDASASMDWGNPNKFLFARRMALCLGVVALRAGHRLRVHGLGGLCPPDLAGLRGGSRSLPLSRWLLDARADGGSDLAETVGRVSGGRQGRGVLILLSDCLEEGAADAVRRAASSGWETWVLRTLCPEELDPGANGLAGDLRLEDVEQDGGVEITVNRSLLQAYRTRLNADRSRLESDVRRAGGRLVELDTSLDPELVLFELLRRGGLLR